MKTQEELAQKKALCEKARARLESWQRPRVDYIEPDGTSRRATEEERQAEIKKSQESIDEFCN